MFMGLPASPPSQHQSLQGNANEVFAFIRLKLSKFRHAKYCNKALKEGGLGAVRWNILSALSNAQSLGQACFVEVAWFLSFKDAKVGDV